MSENKKYRTVTINLDGEFEGQSAEMRADGISARIFVELSSNSVERQMNALANLILSHSLKDAEGNPVEDVLEAPLDALVAVMGKWGDAVAALPPR
jgi:hypothetical protein